MTVRSAHGIARISCLAGAFCWLFPWAMRHFDLTERGVHGDLIFIAWISGIAFVVESIRPPKGLRTVRVAAAVLIAVVVGANLPALLSRAFSSGASAVDRYLIGGAFYHLLWYAMAAAAATGLGFAGARAGAKEGAEAPPDAASD